MSEKSTRHVRLAPASHAWLAAMAEANALTVGKAFRCCINWAAQAGAGASDLGSSAPADSPGDASVELEATKGQWAWLDGQGVPGDTAAAALVAVCQSHAATGANAAGAIFKVVRCKSNTRVAVVATADTPCAGAQAALQAAAGTARDATSACGCLESSK